MWRRTLRCLGIAFIASAGTYLVLLLFPYPLFAHHVQYENLAVYSDQPLSPRLPSLLGEVQKRLQASPFNDSRLPHRMFICNRPGLFAFFANVNHGVGGITYSGLNRNIFLRRAIVDRNRLVGPSGREVPGERTLVYYMTHEITHSLVVHHLGRYQYWHLPVWKREGYADYVGRDGDFHFHEQLAAFQRGAREMDPERSGLYLRYQLLTAYLLDIRGFAPHQMLTEQWDQTSLERELRNMR